MISDILNFPQHIVSLFCYQNLLLKFHVLSTFNIKTTRFVASSALRNTMDSFWYPIMNNVVWCWFRWLIWFKQLASWLTFFGNIINISTYNTVYFDQLVNWSNLALGYVRARGWTCSVECLKISPKNTILIFTALLSKLFLCDYHNSLTCRQTT